MTYRRGVKQDAWGLAQVSVNRFRERDPKYIDRRTYDMIDTNLMNIAGILRTQVGMTARNTNRFKHNDPSAVDSAYLKLGTEDRLKSQPYSSQLPQKITVPPGDTGENWISPWGFRLPKALHGENLEIELNRIKTLEAGSPKRVVHGERLPEVDVTGANEVLVSRSQTTAPLRSPPRSQPMQLSSNSEDRYEYGGSSWDGGSQERYYQALPWQAITTWNKGLAVGQGKSKIGYTILPNKAFTANVLTITEEDKRALLRDEATNYTIEYGNWLRNVWPMHYIPNIKQIEAENEALKSKLLHLKRDTKVSSDEGDVYYGPDQHEVTALQTHIKHLEQTIRQLKHQASENEQIAARLTESIDAKEINIKEIQQRLVTYVSNADTVQQSSIAEIRVLMHSKQELERSLDIERQHLSNAKSQLKAVGLSSDKSSRLYINSVITRSSPAIKADELPIAIKKQKEIVDLEKKNRKFSR